MHSPTITQLYLSLLLIAGASSFAPRSTIFHHRLAPLHVGATWDPRSSENSSNHDELYWMEHAQSCATSDSCSLEENKLCLENVIRIQTECSAGGSLMEEVEACDDVSAAAEIVATLRSKIAKQSQALRSAIAGVMVVSAAFLGCLFAIVATAGVFVDPAATPFTPQEWWWSIRDGYLPLMLKESYQYGGLAGIGINMESTPFTLQEFWWAIQGGYLDNLLWQYFQHGGLPIDNDATTVAVSTAPFTPQEWSFALKGGYLPQILSQTFVNGGWTDVEQPETLPITPQEWIWAARGNYLGDLVKSFVENGGL